MIQKQGARPELWRFAWRILTSDRLMAFWLLVLAVVALIWFFVPQAPPNAYQQEDGLDTWFESVRYEIGDLAENLRTLGFLTVSHSPWFRLVLAGLTLTLLLRAYDAGSEFLSPSPLTAPVQSLSINLPIDPETSLHSVANPPQKGWQKNHRKDEGGSHHLYFRYPLSALGPIAITLGLLVIIGGWLHTGMIGWQYDRVRMIEGSTTQLPIGGATLRLESIDFNWDLLDHDNRVSIAVPDDGNEFLGIVNLTLPWRRKGVSYRLDSIGPAIKVDGIAPDGDPIEMQSVSYLPPQESLTLLLPPEDDLRSFAGPAQGIVIQLGIDSLTPLPSISTRAYQGRAGDLVANYIFEDNLELAVDGSLFFLQVIPYAEFTITYSPGRSIMLVGILLFGFGLIYSHLVPRRKLEIIARGSEENCRVTFQIFRNCDSKWLADLLERTRCDLGVNVDDN